MDLLYKFIKNIICKYEKHQKLCIKIPFLVICIIKIYLFKIILKFMHHLLIIMD